MDFKLVFDAVKKGINSGAFVLIDVRGIDEVRNDGKIPSSHLIPREYIFYIFISKITKTTTRQKLRVAALPGEK